MLCSFWQTQFLCYIELLLGSGNHPPIDDGESSPQNPAQFSVLPIAVAMYLILSIAAADLWGGLALVLEGRGSGNFIWLTSRRTFGACLLLTFGALVGASTRVLFYSSSEDVEVVLAAAAVLFITDVDEKVTPVLKNVSGEWRFFWVIEAIGLSCGLALTVIKLTGNDDTVNKGSRCESVWETRGCGVYDWFFILSTHLTAVTVLALVVVRAVSRPDISLLIRVLHPPSGSWSCFSSIMVVWVLYQIFYSLDESLLHLYVSASLGVTMLLVGGTALFIGCDYCRQLKSACTIGSSRFRPVDRRRRRWLFWSEIGLVLARLIINLILAWIRANEDVSGQFGEIYVDKVYDTLFALLSFLQASHTFVTYVWLIFGMELNDLHSPSCLNVDPAQASTPPLISMLVGWCSCEGLSGLVYFVAEGWVDDDNLYRYGFVVRDFVYDVTDIMWLFMLGTLLWGWTGKVRNIAYWHAATFLVYELISCVGIWAQAASDGIMG